MNRLDLRLGDRLDSMLCQECGRRCPPWEICSCRETEGLLPVGGVIVRPPSDYRIVGEETHYDGLVIAPEEVLEAIAPKKRKMPKYTTARVKTRWEYNGQVIEAYETKRMLTVDMAQEF